jgi:hypothetical protein
VIRNHVEETHYSTKHAKTGGVELEFKNMYLQSQKDALTFKKEAFL